MALAPGEGYFKDAFNSLCLGWHQLEGAPDSIALRGQQDLRTSRCRSKGQEDAKEHHVFQEDGPHYCIKGIGMTVSGLCLNVAGKPPHPEVKGEFVHSTPVAHLTFAAEIKSAVKLVAGTSCVVAPLEGGYVTSGHVEEDECSQFEPVHTFADIGAFRDKATGLCVGWTVEGATPAAPIQSIEGLQTSDCSEWQERSVLQQFVAAGESGYCLQEQKGPVRVTGICLRPA